MLRGLIAPLALLILSPATFALELRNVQACYGRYGPARTKLEVAPHEELMFRFVIVGLKTDKDGKTDALLTTTLTDANGHDLLSRPQAIRETLPFEAESCPGTASLLVGPTAAPGEYQLRVTIEDKLGGGSTRFIRKVVVQSADFRLLSPRFFVDPARTLPGPCGGLVGQTLYVRTQIAQPSRRDDWIACSLKLRVVDLNGKDMLQTPVVIRREVRSQQDYQILALEAELPLSAAGDFRLVLTATDENTKQEATLELPLVISWP